MSDPLISYRSSETESYEAVLQVFDCECIPVPPGTKADPNRRRSSRSGPSRAWWLVTVGVGAAALVVGWLLGRI
jgi:hypothetical protein